MAVCTAATRPPVRLQNAPREATVYRSVSWEAHFPIRVDSRQSLLFLYSIFNSECSKFFLWEHLQLHYKHYEFATNGIIEAQISRR